MIVGHWRSTCLSSLEDHDSHACICVLYLDRVCDRQHVRETWSHAERLPSKLWSKPHCNHIAVSYHFTYRLMHAHAASRLRILGFDIPIPSTPPILDLWLCTVSAAGAIASQPQDFMSREHVACHNADTSTWIAFVTSNTFARRGTWIAFVTSNTFARQGAYLEPSACRGI